MFLYGACRQDGWTSEDLQAWFKKCGSNIDQVVQFYTSMWANSDNDLSTVRPCRAYHRHYPSSLPPQNIANVSFDLDDNDNKWVFKCGASSD